MFNLRSFFNRIFYNRPSLSETTLPDDATCYVTVRNKNISFNTRTSSRIDFHNNNISAIRYNVASVVTREVPMTITKIQNGTALIVRTVTSQGADRGTTTIYSRSHIQTTVIRSSKDITKRDSGVDVK